MLILIKFIDAVLSFFMSVECALGHYAKENFGLQLLCNGSFFKFATSSCFIMILAFQTVYLNNLW